MSNLRSLLPDRDWYLKGTHAGTDVWRHQRTALTPAHPRWMYEGLECDCGGHLTTYKYDAYDTGVAGPQLHDCPSPNSTAGYSICDSCFSQAVIPLSEVIDVPVDMSNVIAFDK